MKKIHLLRHAKSDWGNASTRDIDRPLNKRGIRTAQFMAQQLVDAGCNFTHVFCSPALRARTTIEHISAQLPERKPHWEIDKNLYTFEERKLHDWFRSLDESINECMIIGHNPALTNFNNALSNINLMNIPTCGYVQLTAQKAATWQEISQTPFELTTMLTPKTLMKTSRTSSLKST